MTIKKFYINYKYNASTPTETIDHAKSFSEAEKMLKEYRLSGEGSYYLSTRHTKKTSSRVLGV